MVACAFCFHPERRPNKAFLQELTDSKKLSEKKRETLYQELINMSV
ncbi:MAG: hypothetical protein H6767_05430 [Candidatus Peribacteria bacterium]|nr:MAG: hypothetical protein H6767_05430 [Candidatus Peribacteria bacterium]